MLFLVLSNHALIIFDGARVGGGASCDTQTYVLFFYLFLFKTFLNALTISWNILILTFYRLLVLVDL